MTPHQQRRSRQPRSHEAEMKSIERSVTWRPRAIYALVITQLIAMGTGAVAGSSVPWLAFAITVCTFLLLLAFTVTAAVSYRQGHLISVYDLPSWLVMAMLVWAVVQLCAATILVVL